MLIVADPDLWSVDPVSGLTRYMVPLCAGATRVVLSIDRADPASVDVQAPGLLERPTVRQRQHDIVVVCPVLCPERSFASVTMRERPSQMTARVFVGYGGVIGWHGLVPSSLARPSPAKPTSSALDLVALSKMLEASEIDKALDEMTAVWAETPAADRSAATIMLFEFLAEHPLKRAIVLGALMASLCNFRAST